jgi:hypothetical protein
MNTFARAAVIVALVIPALSASAPANAGDGGAVAAGVAGGLLGGLFLGSALAGPRYYEPAPVYVVPAPPPSYCIGLAEGHIGMIGVGRGYGLVFGYAIKLIALRPS